MTGDRSRLIGLILVIGLISALVPATQLEACGQDVPVGGVVEEYLRVLQVRGDRPITPSSTPLNFMDGSVASDTTAAFHPWQQVLAEYEPHIESGALQWGVADPTFGAYLNSTRPHGRNDGALWQGRGGTFAFDAGGYAAYGSFSASLRPRILYNENRTFALSPDPPPDGVYVYGYPAAPGDSAVSIDLPQRFGTVPFWTVDWGESDLTFDIYGVSGGLSHRSLWWGPGIRNGIVMSSNAPGFWHATLGTSRPLTSGVGRFEGRILGGFLRESDYFDADPGNDRRYLSGLVLEYQPVWLHGLWIGFAQTRTYDLSADGLGLFDYVGALRLPFNDADGEQTDASNELFSFFGRWVLPENGFELYAEWSREADPESITDFLVVPEFSSGFVFGFQKVFVLAPHDWLRFQAEIIKLEQNRARIDPGSIFYMHRGVEQGYTHRGQVLGAGIGPGSNEQSVGFDWFARWGRLGFVGFRMVHDNDRYYLRPQANNYEHEVELAFGSRMDVFLGAWEIHTELTFGRLLNKNYVFKNDEWNVNAHLGLRYRLMGLR